MFRSGRDLRVEIARQLEEGVWSGAIARVAAEVWGAVSSRSVARPVALPPGIRVVAVGGATLGGSGKTPLAIACARALAARGARVAFIGHGYGARPRVPRVVGPDDPVALVGDEAVVAARALRGLAAVVVAPSRQAALEHTARIADVVVLDGVLQLAPNRVGLSLLALDGESPWGAGAVVPRGDLRAPKRALLAACDEVVVLRDETDPSAADSVGSGHEPHLVRVSSRGAFVDGELVHWSSLRRLRLGLFVALARPSRLLAMLRRRGIVPERVVRVSDHGIPQVGQAPHARRLGADVDLWLASPKCAIHLENAEISYAVLEYEVALDAPLLRLLARLLQGEIPQGRPTERLHGSACLPQPSLPP